MAPQAGTSHAEVVQYWKRQIEIYESHRERGELNSRRYLTAARAQKELGDRTAAGGLAKRALLTHRRDGLLTEREQEYAKALAGGG